MNNSTVFCYFNGNNELEPEIHRSLIKINKLNLNNNIKVILQISRAEKELIKIIRKNKNLEIPGEKNWSGVRRYLLTNDGLELLEKCGNINMADPQNLTRYLQWGTENFLSENNILIMGGHSIKYIGSMIDYSQDSPYFMSLQEMCKAIGKVSQLKINLLILDICYMNTLELIYELASQENINYMLTYIDKGPLSGLPYNKVIKLIKKICKLGNIEVIINKIIDNLDKNLIAFKLNFHRLKKVKQIFNQKADQLIAKEKNENLKKQEIRKVYKKMITELSPSIFSDKKHGTYKKLINFIDFNPLQIPYGKYSFKFSFYRFNQWPDLLIRGINERKMMNIKPSPIKISPKVLFKLLSAVNPVLDTKEVKNILLELYRFKNWNFN